MTTSYRFIQCSDRNEWDEFVKASPQGSVFCLSHFLNSCLGIKVEKYFVYANNEKTAEAAYLIIRDEKTNRIIKQPFPHCSYMGIMFKDGGDRSLHSTQSHQLRVTSEIISHLVREYQFFSMSHAPEFVDLRAFQWLHFDQKSLPQVSIEIKFTGIIEKNTLGAVTEQSLLETFRKCRRHEIRKAAALKVQETKEVSTFMPLYELAFLRQGIQLTAPQLALARALLESGLENGYARLLTASFESKPVGGVAFFFCQDRAYYLMGATDPEFRRLNSTTILLFQQIKDAFALRNCNTVDVIGINSPHRGDFKLSFGAKIVPYYLTHFQGVDNPREAC